MICQTNSVQGIQIADEEILLFQFADDATVFLDGTTDCFCSYIRILFVHVYAYYNVNALFPLLVFG